MKNKIQDCKVCYKIKCRDCGWEPDEAELGKVLTGKLTNCPNCGWSPSVVRIL